VKFLNCCSTSAGLCFKNVFTPFQALCNHKFLKFCYKQIKWWQFFPAFICDKNKFNVVWQLNAPATIQRSIWRRLASLNDDGWRRTFRPIKRNEHEIAALTMPLVKGSFSTRLRGRSTPTDANHTQSLHCNVCFLTTILSVEQQLLRWSCFWELRVDFLVLFYKLVLKTFTLIVRIAGEFQHRPLVWVFQRYFAWTGTYFKLACLFVPPWFIFTADN